MTEKRTSLQKLGMTGRPSRPSKMRRLVVQRMSNTFSRGR